MSSRSIAHPILQWLLHYRRIVFAAVVVLTAPAAWVLSTSEFAPSIVESFVDSRQEYLDAMAQEANYIKNPDSLLWLATDEGDQLFTPETLNAIQAAADDLERLDAVDNVTCLPEVNRKTTVGRGMRSATQRILLNAKLKQGQVPSHLDRVLSKGTPIWPRNPARRPSELQMQSIREEISGGEMVASQFVSGKQTAHVMLVELAPTSQLPPAKQITLVNDLREIVTEHGLGTSGVYLSGLVALQGFAFQQIGIVLQTLLPLGGVLIALAVMVVFKRIEVILFTLLIAAISICWGIALGVVVYGKFSALMAAVPLMVLVISTADVIHLLSAYTAERSAGHEHVEALRKMFSEVGGACVLTSLTTFVGFASLIMVPSNTIRQFGFATAAGVASALLLSVLLAPLFLDWLNSRGKPIRASASSSRIAIALSKACLTLSLRWYRQVLVAFVLLLAVSAVLTSRVTLDPDLTRRFRPTHSVTQSTKFFAEEFGGINAIELVLSGSAQDLLDPQTFAGLTVFEEKCKSQLSATRVDSVATVVSPFLKTLDFKNELGMPESHRHAGAVIQLIRKIEPSVIDVLATREMNQLRVLVRIQQTSYMEMLEVSTAIMELAEATFGSRLEVREKGSAPMVGRAVREIIRGHMQGFMFCFTTIFILIVAGLRSLKLGWLSILPNLTPLFFLGGVLGMLYSRVDSDILAVATLGLGLAVDDTIHFLSRFRIELRSGQDVKAALDRTMSHTGVAIIRTTVILSVGFFPFAFAGYWSINMLGTYLITVLFAALVADLILLPAILRLAYWQHKSLARSIQMQSVDV